MLKCVECGTPLDPRLGRSRHSNPRCDPRPPWWLLPEWQEWIAATRRSATVRPPEIAADGLTPAAASEEPRGMIRHSQIPGGEPGENRPEPGGPDFTGNEPLLKDIWRGLYARYPASQSIADLPSPYDFARAMAAEFLRQGWQPPADPSGPPCDWWHPASHGGPVPASGIEPTS